VESTDARAHPVLCGDIWGSADSGGPCAAASAHPSEINGIEQLVTKAVALVESKGREAAFAKFGKRDSEWWHGDTYLFAYDMNGRASGSRGSEPRGHQSGCGKGLERKGVSPCPY
jgi:hypothetical protein